MKCPICPNAVLAITERQGIEIDYCPVCRGVWLDRGELDKLIEKSLTASTPAPTAPAPAPTAPSQPPQPQHNYAYHGDSSGRLKAVGHHKRKSWLSELFD